MKSVSLELCFASKISSRSAILKDNLVFSAPIRILISLASSTDLIFARSTGSAVLSLPARIRKVSAEISEIFVPPAFTILFISSDENIKLPFVSFNAFNSKILSFSALTSSSEYSIIAGLFFTRSRSSVCENIVFPSGVFI